MQVQFRGDWQVELCTSPSCGAGPLRVRRDPCRADSWWVGRLEGGTVWHEAASEPCCPFRGEDLTTAMPQSAPAGRPSSPHAA